MEESSSQLTTSFGLKNCNVQGHTTVLGSVCQMADVSAGGVGLGLMPATLTEDLTTTGS